MVQSGHSDQKNTKNNSEKNVIYTGYICNVLLIVFIGILKLFFLIYGFFLVI